jgi:hypothetical protein
VIGVTDKESGRAIALVILGIVAVIAIVGLVLLFTGAKKTATGEFYVPEAKVYGGAIRDVQFPYSRAFAGKAVEYPSGATGEYGSGAYPLGDSQEASVLGTTDLPYSTYKRGDNQIATLVGGSCSILTRGEYPVESSWNQAQAAMSKGLTCIFYIEDMYGEVAPVNYVNGNAGCCQYQPIM